MLTTRTVDAEGKHSNSPKLAYFFAVVSLDHFLYALYQHFANFLQWWCANIYPQYKPRSTVLPLSHITLDPHTVTLSSTSLNSYNLDLLKTLTLTHRSVLAAIQNAAQKRRRHMP